jgi:hypothetical protein
VAFSGTTTQAGDPKENIAMSTNTTTSNPCPDVPMPGGAVTAEWQDAGTPNAFRYFEGSRWVVDRRVDRARSEDIEVYVAGTQEPDGTVVRDIVVHQLHSDDPIMPRQARQLARALIAAADEIDRWTAR